MILTMSNDTFKAKAEKVWGSVKTYCRIKKAITKARWSKFKVWLRKVFSSQDAKAFFNAVFTIIMNGLMISGLLYYFIGFHWHLVLPFGAGWWFAKKELLDQLRRLLSSINLIRIGK